MLAEPRPGSIAELQTRAGAPAAGLPSTDIALVLDTLVHEGLVDPNPRMVRIN
jgi:DNA-binding IclR family transcriptional regulator